MPRATSPAMTYHPLTALIREASGGDHPPTGAQTRFAGDVGTTSATVSRWRSGTIPNAEWWPRLGELLGVDVAQLVDDESAPTDEDQAEIIRAINQATESAMGLLRQLVAWSAEVDEKLDRLLADQASRR